MSNEQFRKYVNLIDNGPQKKKRSINESADARIKYRRMQALTEAQRLVQLIENNHLTEEQLDELLGGLGAVAGAAGRGIAGAAGAAGRAVQGAAGAAGRGIAGAAGAAGRGIAGAGRAVQGAAGAAGRAVQGAAGATGRAVQGAASKVGDIYQQGETVAKYNKEKQTFNNTVNRVYNLIKRAKVDFNAVIKAVKQMNQLPAPPEQINVDLGGVNESRRYRRR